MTHSSFPSRLNHLHFFRFQSLFASLQAVDPAELEGRYAAQFTGPAWLRRVAPPSLALLHFKGWCGKRFDRGGGNGINLFRRGGLLEKYPFHTTLQASLLDGKPSLAVHYDNGSPFPWGYVIDELRRLDEKYILGMTLIRQRGFAKLAFPFLLFPWEDNNDL